MAASDTTLPSEPTRSCATQSRIYAGIGDVVAVIEALGIDPKQYFDTVPGALGYTRRGHPALSHSETAAWRRS